MRKSVLSLLLLFLALGVAWAQKRQITVSGTVVSSYDKEPVVAASVVCTDFPGTGSLTDVNGRFSFKVPAEARTLTISCIGYTTQKVPITEGAMNIILKSEERVTETVVSHNRLHQRAEGCTQHIARRQAHWGYRWGQCELPIWAAWELLYRPYPWARLHQRRQ